MKKRLFSLIFVLVLLISAMVLAFSIRKTYAKYSSVSNATQTLTLTSKSHSGETYTLEHTGDKTQHKKTWGCCGYVEYEAHKYNGDTDFTCDCGYIRHEHTYTFVDKVDSTCTATGMEAHYVCDGDNGCEKVFDANTKAEVEASTLVIAMKEHSYTVTAWNDTHHYKKCSACSAIDESSKMAHSAKDDAWYSDETYHYHLCSCGYHMDEAAHTATSGGTAEAHEVCSVCSRTLNADHSYTSDVTKAATCEETGVRTYTCSCTASYTEDIAALGHDFKTSTDTGKLKSSATCQVQATYWRKCSRCDKYSETEYFSSGEKAACVYSDTTSNQHLATSATCQAAATYYDQCKWCGKQGTSTHSVGSTVACVYSDKSTNKYNATSATCQAAATYYDQCKWCGNQGTSTHSAGSKATCDYSDKSTNKYNATSATCQAAATYYDQCKWCGKQGTSTHSVGNVANHNYNTQTVSETYLCSRATCTAAAKYYYKCQWCSKYSTATTYDYGTANGHTSVNGGTETVHTKCSVCGATTSTAHNYTSSTVTIQPTCTANGTTKYTCSCGWSKTEQDVTALGHSFTVSEKGSLISAATCTSAAKYWKKCSRCSTYASSGDAWFYSESETALGHSWSDTYTKTSNTQHSRTCTRSGCGEKEYTAHTMTHSAASGSTGTVSCSKSCGYSLTPTNFIDAYELTTYDIGGTFGEITYANDKDVGRGMWTKFDGVTSGKGYYIDVPLNNIRYMVIEYGDMYGVSTDFAGQSFIHVQYFIHGVNILHTYQIQNTLTSGVQGTGLCTEIFDFGTEAAAIAGTTVGNYVRLYMWQTTAAMHIKSIAFFNTASEAEEYQDMLAQTSGYPVLDCGYAEEYIQK